MVEGRFERGRDNDVQPFCKLSATTRQKADAEACVIWQDRGAAQHAEAVQLPFEVRTPEPSRCPAQDHHRSHRPMLPKWRARPKEDGSIY